MNIVVLTGGISPEREVSLASGRGVAAALREAGHTVTVVDPAYGTSQPATEEILFSDATHGDMPAEEKLEKFSTTDVIACIQSPLFDSCDVVFNIIHGAEGEDGTLQALLELRKVVYTGSGVLASALAINKIASKIVFQHEGVATPRWVEVRQHVDMQDFYERVQKLGIPYVVKPNVGGSTLGLTVVDRTGFKPFHAAVLEAQRYSPVALAEEFIAGKELTVSVVGDDALPVIEIVPEGGLYDYKHKYTKGMTQYFCPADIGAEVTKSVQRDALRAFSSLGCKGFGRIDFRYAADGTAHCLEVNTVPGMTATSLVPKAAAAAGISFAQLCDRIAREAVSAR